MIAFDICCMYLKKNYSIAIDVNPCKRDV